MIGAAVSIVGLLVIGYGIASLVKWANSEPARTPVMNLMWRCPVAGCGVTVSVTTEIAEPSDGESVQYGFDDLVAQHLQWHHPSKFHDDDNGGVHSDIEPNP